MPRLAHVLKLTKSTESSIGCCKGDDLPFSAILSSSAPIDVDWLYISLPATGSDCGPEPLRYPR